LRLSLACLLASACILLSGITYTKQIEVLSTVVLGIEFGGGNPNNGNTNELFFVAGPDTYFGGVFGKIVVEKDPDNDQDK